MIELNITIPFWFYYVLTAFIICGIINIILSAVISILTYRISKKRKKFYEELS